MNYEAIYNSLMERSKGRTLFGYSETHHVKPRCMGGDNSKDNLVVLTAEEHYVAHLLLVKMHPGHHGLLWAAMAMTNGTKLQQRSNNKMYGWLRRRFAENMSARPVSAEVRARLSAQKMGNKSRLGMLHLEETKVKMSAASKGKPKSKAHRTALSISKTGKARGPHTAATREKIRLGLAATTRDLSFTQNPEYKAAQADKMRRIWAERRQGVFPMPNHKLTT